MEWPQHPEPRSLPVLTDVVEDSMELLPVQPVRPIDEEALAQRVMARVEGMLQQRMKHMLEGVVETLISEQSAQLAEDLRPDMQALVREAIRHALGRSEDPAGDKSP